MTNPDKTLIAALLDRSGSMQSSLKATIDGFNELINGQKAEPGEAIVTLAQFDTHPPVPEFVYTNKPIDEVPGLALNPRGMTPLLDATGEFVTQIGTSLAALDEDQRPGLVICLIMTDGHENASRDWTWDRVKALIKTQQDEFSWHFVFIGANINSGKVAGDMGIPQAAAMDFDASDYDSNVSAYAAMSRNVSGLRGGQILSASFTDQERGAAKKSGKHHLASKS